MIATAITPAAIERELTAEEARRVSLFLDYAEFCGMQPDGEGGSFELWNLRKAIPGHPKGSTVTRATVERAIQLLHG
jgi:hypothetical protein